MGFTVANYKHVGYLENLGIADFGLHGVVSVIYLNPDDAAARNIADGDLVEVFNARGTCLSAAIVSAAIMQGVARLATGAWFDYDWQTGLEKHGNPNALTRDIGASSLSQGCTAQTCLVDVRRADGPIPAVTAHTLPALLQT